MNITDILDELGIPYRHNGAAKDVRAGRVGIECPICGRGDFGLAIFRRVAFCWRCQAMSIPKALAEASKRPVWEVHKLLDGIELPEPEPDRRGKLVEPDGVGGLLPLHKKYLKSRGFDPDVISDIWDVQGIGMASQLPWRLYLPVRNHAGDKVSWTTRSLTECKDRRYINAKPEQEIASSRSVLYGEHLAGHGVVVVEGPTDAWRIGPGGCATLGMSWTGEQVTAIGRHPQRCVCFDAEPAAQQKAWQLAKELMHFPGSTEVVRPRTGKDPATMDQAEIDEIRRAFLR